MTTLNTRTCRRENATTQSPPAATPLFLCSSSPGIDCPEPVLAKFVIVPSLSWQKQSHFRKKRSDGNGVSAPRTPSKCRTACPEMTSGDSRPYSITSRLSPAAAQSLASSGPERRKTTTIFGLRKGNHKS